MSKRFVKRTVKHDAVYLPDSGKRSVFALRRAKRFADGAGSAQKYSVMITGRSI